MKGGELTLMTDSTPATFRPIARPGGRALRAKAHSTQSNQFPKMNLSINFEGDGALHGIMSDLGVDYALSPFHRIGFEIDDAGIQKLAAQYQERVFRARKWADCGSLSWTTLLLRFDEGAFLVALGDGRNCAEVIAPQASQVTALYDEVRKVLDGEDQPKQPAFYMLRHDCGDFTADPIKNVPEAVTDDFLRLCYGPDILTWITRFGEKTLARAGVLTIFDGPPGTGKTSLITQMIWRLDQTHVFYSLPVSQDSALSSPEMVPFWQKQNTRHADRVKVIVLEDAERLLWRRDGDNREAVSSLLNIADGLMGRMLRLHVICSVNARMEDLDPAILRPGRLMNHRRFNPLTREAAERVAAARDLVFQPGAPAESYTLAEALNPGAYEAPRAKQSIGFKVTSDT
jgi:hypothetical protein